MPQNKQKIHWVIVISGKIVGFQRVGHPISCLGACYPKKHQKKGGAWCPLLLRFI